VIYVDGFCGPGRYKGGEPGSPVIALQVALEHKERLKGELVFLFVDNRADRIEHLKAELGRIALPANFAASAEEGRFDELFLGLLRSLKEDRKTLAPSFVFIDPFGFSGVPFELVQQVLQNPRCEVMITFMVNPVQRFLEHPDDTVRSEFISLFGTADVLEIANRPGDRVEMLRQLYQRQLVTVAKFVRSFEIRDHPNRVLYYVFFASNHPLGHLKMKEAMWGVDPSGGFAFCDNTDPQQLILLDPGFDSTEQLGRTLAKHFASRTVNALEIKQFVVDHTGFIERHKTAALRALEQRNLISVPSTKTTGKKRKKGTFPDDVLVSFV
jgi:three-Cys-motif partner protein